MPLDPRIILAGQSPQIQPYDVRPTLEGIANLQRSQQVLTLGDLAREEGQLGLQERQRGIAEQGQARQALQQAIQPDGTVDQQLLLRNLGQAGLYGQYQGAQKSMLEQAKTLGELHESQARTQRLGTQAEADRSKVMGEALPIVHQALGAILANPTQENYVGTLQQLRQLLPPSLSHLVDEAPPVVDTGYLERAYRQTTDAKLAMDAAKLEQDRQLTTQGQALTARGQDITARGQDLTRLTAQEDQIIKRLEMADKTAGRTRSTEEQLRGELTKLSKDFREQSTAYGRIQQSATTPGAASAIALVFGYMKLLDPTSTVREGEQASVRNAVGVPDQVRNLYNKLMSGDSINAKQRNEILAHSERLYEQAEKDYAKTEGLYTGLAERYGASPENVVLDARTTAARTIKALTPATIARTLESARKTRPDITEEQVVEILKKQGYQ